jgi:hypothetical protein
MIGTGTGRHREKRQRSGVINRDGGKRPKG